MNFVFISPHFPKTYYQFCQELKNNGVNVLGIASDWYGSLTDEVKNSLTEYYQVNNMENYDDMYRAVAYFAHKYGKIDFIESNNEYWLEQDARLRSDFNVNTGKKEHEINFFKSKEAMKEGYHKAGIPVARYHIPSTYELGLEFIKEVGYPVIVKPDNGVGAYNTYKITNEEELKAFYYEHFPSIKYIMEEFIKGDLISYDGITNGEADVVFHSNEVFPDPVMNIVNEHLDCHYYSNKEMPKDLEEAGKKVLKAFDAKYRYFHLEFFRLTEGKKGLGKKGDIVGLEVNMRSPGGYTPDMINYSKSVSTYKIWADVMTYNSTLQDLNKDKYFCVYYGRRDDKHYVMSIQDIKNKYWNKIKVTDRLPDVLSGAMGNDFFIANCSNKEEMEEFIADCSKLD